jgi:chemotaxis signal transduction protein
MLNWDSRMVEGVGHYQERAVTVLDVDGLLSTAVLAEAMEGGDDV